MDMMWLLRDTRNCLLVMFTDLIGTASGIAGIVLLSARFGGIGGMSEAQVLFMLGYATCIDGLFMLFFGMTNTGMISRIIGRGQFEHMLVQPVPLPIQIFTSGFIPFTGSSVLAGGIALTVAAARPLGMSANPLWIPVMAASLVASLAVILAFSYLIGSAAFYAPVAAEEISSSAVGFFDATKRFPLGGLPLPLQLVYCTILPAGLVAWLPASRILGLPAAGLSLFFLTAVALGLGTVATIVFRKGLRHYAKFGTQRYSEHAHRR
jgi:ABC-2 type transport system permease protein